MDFNISDEKLDEIARDAVADYVYRTMDDYYIRQKADELIRKAVEDALSEKFKATVRAIVDEFLTGPVDLNDGWGYRERYDSYSDFFAAQIRKKLDESYEIKRVLRDAVNECVNKAWDEYKDEAIKTVLANASGD